MKGIILYNPPYGLFHQGQEKMRLAVSFLLPYSIHLQDCWGTRKSSWIILVTFSSLVIHEGELVLQQSWRSVESHTWTLILAPIVAVIYAPPLEMGQWKIQDNLVLLSKLKDDRGGVELCSVPLFCPPTKKASQGPRRRVKLGTVEVAEACPLSFLLIEDAYMKGFLLQMVSGQEQSPTPSVLNIS